MWRRASELRVSALSPCPALADPSTPTPEAPLPGAIEPLWAAQATRSLGVVDRGSMAAMEAAGVPATRRSAHLWSGVRIFASNAVPYGAFVGQAPPVPPLVASYHTAAVLRRDKDTMTSMPRDYLICAIKWRNIRDEDRRRRLHTEALTTLVFNGAESGLEPEAGTQVACLPAWEPRSLVIMLSQPMLELGRALLSAYAERLCPGDWAPAHVAGALAFVRAGFSAALCPLHSPNDMAQGAGIDDGMLPLWTDQWNEAEDEDDEDDEDGGTPLAPRDEPDSAPSAGGSEPRRDLDLSGARGSAAGGVAFLARQRTESTLTSAGDATLAGLGGPRPVAAGLSPLPDSDSVASGPGHAGRVAAAAAAAPFAGAGGRSAAASSEGGPASYRALPAIQAPDSEASGAAGLPGLARSASWASAGEANPAAHTDADADADAARGVRWAVSLAGWPRLAAMLRWVPPAPADGESEASEATPPAVAKAGTTGGQGRAGGSVAAGTGAAASAAGSEAGKAPPVERLRSHGGWPGTARSLMAPQPYWSEAAVEAALAEGGAGPAMPRAPASPVAGASAAAPARAAAPEEQGQGGASFAGLARATSAHAPSPSSPALGDRGPLHKPLPYVDVDWTCLLGRLPARAITACLQALLNQREVILVSQDTSACADVVVALQAMLAPLRWPLLCSSGVSVSESRESALGLPFPRILGITPHHALNGRDNNTVAMGPPAQCGSAQSLQPAARLHLELFLGRAEERSEELSARLRGLWSAARRAERAAGARSGAGAGSGDEDDGEGKAAEPEAASAADEDDDALVLPPALRSGLLRACGLPPLPPWARPGCGQLAPADFLTPADVRMRRVAPVVSRTSLRVLTSRGASTDGAPDQASSASPSRSGSVRGTRWRGAEAEAPGSLAVGGAATLRSASSGRDVIEVVKEEAGEGGGGASVRPDNFFEGWVEVTADGAPMGAPGVDFCPGVTGPPPPLPVGRALLERIRAVADSKRSDSLQSMLLVDLDSGELNGEECFEKGTLPARLLARIFQAVSAFGPLWTGRTLMPDEGAAEPKLPPSVSLGERKAVAAVFSRWKRLLGFVSKAASIAMAGAEERAEARWETLTRRLDAAEAEAGLGGDGAAGDAVAAWQRLCEEGSGMWGDEPEDDEADAPPAWDEAAEASSGEESDGKSGAGAAAAAASAASASGRAATARPRVRVGAPAEPLDPRDREFSADVAYNAGSEGWTRVPSFADSMADPMKTPAATRARQGPAATISGWGRALVRQSGGVPGCAAAFVQTAEPDRDHGAEPGEAARRAAAAMAGVPSRSPASRSGSWSRVRRRSTSRGSSGSVDSGEAGRGGGGREPARRARFRTDSGSEGSEGEEESHAELATFWDQVVGRIESPEDALASVQPGPTLGTLVLLSRDREDGVIDTLKETRGSLGLMAGAHNAEYGTFHTRMASPDGDADAASSGGSALPVLIDAPSAPWSEWRQARDFQREIAARRALHRSSARRPEGSEAAGAGGGRARGGATRRTEAGGPVAAWGRARHAACGRGEDAVRGERVPWEWESPGAACGLELSQPSGGALGVCTREEEAAREEEREIGRRALTGAQEPPDEDDAADADEEAAAPPPDGRVDPLLAMVSDATDGAYVDAAGPPVTVTGQPLPPLGHAASLRRELVRQAMSMPFTAAGSPAVYALERRVLAVGHLRLSVASLMVSLFRSFRVCILGDAHAAEADGEGGAAGAASASAAAVGRRSSRRGDGEDDSLFGRGFDLELFKLEAGDDASAAVHEIYGTIAFRSFVMERQLLARKSAGAVAARRAALEGRLSRIADASAAVLVGGRAALRAELQGVDYFDAWAFARMTEQAADESRHRTTGFQGRACVATPGTAQTGMYETPGIATLFGTPRRPLWRWLVLENDTLAWYSSVEKHQALDEAMAAIIHRGREERGDEAAKRRIRAKVKKLAGDQIGAYRLEPGRTRLRVPDSRVFPTEFPLELLRDAPREGEPGFEPASRPGAGPGARKLTFCLPSAELRRQWIGVIRSRLQAEDSLARVRETYLTKQELSEPTVRALRETMRSEMERARRIASGAVGTGNA